MFQIVLSAFIALMAVGCSTPRYVDYFPYHDDGTPKPKVALMPVIDSSKSGMPWDVSLELSEAVYSELMNCGEVYALLPQEVGPVWAKRASIDYFGNDMSYCKEFKSADFIVAMELIQNDSTVEPDHPCNQILTMRMRLKVIDVRCDKPRLVLYEIVKAEFITSPKYHPNEYEPICWGCSGFDKTPCGIVHQRMVCALTKRLEEVLWSAK